LINSKTIEFYFKNTAKLKREGYYEYSGGSLSKIPIKQDKRFEDKIVLLVERIISLKTRLNEIGDKKTDERQRIEEEIKKTDQEIDELVYELYGITEEEKKVIDESLKWD
jgi:vacuolar-type H+-ATPase subunit I/STV1